MSSSSDKEPTVCTRPPADETIAIDLLRRVYGVQVEKIKALVGYYDKNYYVRAVDGRQFVLKITNTVETNTSGLIGE